LFLVLTMTISFSKQVLGICYQPESNIHSREKVIRHTCRIPRSRVC
jgi:hypothetical protein